MPSTEFDAPTPTTADGRSDTELVSAVADELRHPREEPADSFVLHAPLELAARTALLPRVPDLARDAARVRITEIATQYEAFGPAVVDPAPRDFDSPPAAAAALARAIDAGDLDEVDATATALARVASAADLRRAARRRRRDPALRRRARADLPLPAPAGRAARRAHGRAAAPPGP